MAQSIRQDAEKALWKVVDAAHQRSLRAPEMIDAGGIWRPLIQYAEQSLQGEPDIADTVVAEVMTVLYAFRQECTDAARCAGDIYRELDQARQHNLVASLSYWKAQQDRPLSF